MWSATAPASIVRPATCISRGSSRSCGRHPIAATVIGGWLKSEAAGRELRSLLVGHREGGQRDGKLVFAGKVGTGFTERLGRDLARRLAGLTRPDSPFAGLPADYRKGAIWVEPRLVAQVDFKTWTADRLLRAASFQGLREDKPAAEVTRERSAR